MSIRKLSQRLKIIISAPEGEEDPTLERRKSGNKSGRNSNTPLTPTRIVRVMLLGAGDSGKSTFFKQVKYIYTK